MALEITNVNPVIITAHMDATGTLKFRYAATDLTPYENQAIAVTADREIRIELPHFDGWTLKAVHLDESDNVVTWTPNQYNANYSFGQPTTDFLEVTVYATKPGMSTATKKIYIQAKPKTSLPDRP